MKPGLVFWKHKQNWKPLNRLTKKKEDPEEQIRNERGEITSNITKIQKKILKSTTNNYMPINWIPRTNGQIFRDMQPAKTGLRRNR